MYYKDFLKDWLLDHLEGYGWYNECPRDCTPPFEVTLKKNHEFDFQEKFTSFGGSNVQVNKKKFVAKGKGKKTNFQEIMEFLEDMTMVNYEVTTSKKDFDDLLEGTDKRHSSRCLDLSPRSRRPSLSRPDFSFRASRRTLSFDSLGGHHPLSSQRDSCLV
jgi:hypothetical protein